MNLSSFLEHWSITENPFRGEEARHDAVFARMGFGVYTPAPVEPARPRAPETMAGDGEPAAARAAEVTPAAPAPRPAAHPDFEKILGEVERPSSAIVFGEKGSGKTAIRLQIADRLATHNAANPERRVLLVAYDDLNGVLDRFHRRAAGKTPLDSFRRFRLVDHIDAVLGQVVPKLVDALLGQAAAGGGSEAEQLRLGPDPRKLARKQPSAAKRDLLLLQAVYDRPDAADLRTARLRRRLRVPLPTSDILWNALAILGWIPAALVFVWAWMEGSGAGGAGFEINSVYGYLVGTLVALWLLVLIKRLGWDGLLMRRLARRLRRQLRVQSRAEASYIRSLRQLDPVARDPVHLPLSDSDEQRYAMLERLRRVLGAFGYAAMVIVIDRVDEPTLVSGDAEIMRALVWPMLNNKFLQQQGIGVKMLLPMELRHALFKESSAFFQEARLDKQNLIERLTWTGAMLYDLCDARLAACRPAGARPITLLDLFGEDVTRQDLVDALEQMHQPRDAFKMLYHVLIEHCAGLTGDEARYRIPRHVLDTVRKQQSDRVQQLYRGIRPA